MCPLIPLLGCLLNGPRGVDVSTFNGTINWAQAADAGLSFAFAKASEGLTIRDDRFAANWAGMKASGLVRGAYHFFRAGDDGAAQADVFLACVGSFEPGDLPPVLDWETGGESDAGSAVAVATDFMAEVQRLTGLTTIVYTTFDYWSSLGMLRSTSIDSPARALSSWRWPAWTLGWPPPRPTAMPALWSRTLRRVPRTAARARGPLR